MKKSSLIIVMSTFILLCIIAIGAVPHTHPTSVLAQDDSLVEVQNPSTTGGWIWCGCLVHGKPCIRRWCETYTCVFGTWWKSCEV